MIPMLELVEDPEPWPPPALPDDPVLGAEGLAGEPPLCEAEPLRREADPSSVACRHRGEVILCRRCGRGVAAAERLVEALDEDWWQEPPEGVETRLRRAG